MNRHDHFVRNAAGECLKGFSKRTREVVCVFACVVMTVFVPGHVCSAWALDAGTLPTGGRIVSGQGSISVSGNQMVVTQQQNKMIANWDTFNIGRSAGVTFQQPNSSSSALNRIADQNPSQIFGSLKANGQVFLVNPSGIVFGSSARVDVGGLVASSLNLSNEDYLSGQYRFTTNGTAGPVTNLGVINASEYGVVALIAPQVSNQGTIAAPLGSVALAAGNRVTLDFSGDGLMNVAVDGAALNAALENQGAIKADGGRVFMTVQAAGDLMATVVNNSGLIEANSISEKNGMIVLDGGSSGSVSVSGVISSAGRNTGETGGTIKMLGARVSLDGNAVLDASGDKGGGTVLVGGNFKGQGPERNARSTTIGRAAQIKADAVTAGNGGKVAVWSDGNTDFGGIISARGGANSGDGGYVEVSGKSLRNDGFGILTAPHGAAGTMLVDPTDYLIAPAGTPGATETGEHVGRQLEYGNYTIVTSSDGTGNGDITVKDSITWNSGNTFYLMAHNDIIFAGSSIYAPSGSIIGRADFDGDNAGTIRVASGTTNSITVGGMAIGFYSPPDWNNPSRMWSSDFEDYVTAGQGKISYALINDVAHLQMMHNDMHANYALGKNIDASATTGWNMISSDAYAGFQPIGNESTPFTGRLEGLGHTITGLYINRGSENNVGLFGVTSGADIRRVGILADYYTGYGNVGGIAGYASNGTTIRDCYILGGVVNSVGSTGSVAGGLVGALSGSAVMNSYSLSSVTAMERTGTAGGLVGVANGSTVTSSYYSTDVTGFTKGAGTGKTTDEMMLRDTYQGWDFTATWWMTSGQTFPFLLPLDTPQQNPVVPDNPVNPVNPVTPVTPTGPTETTVADLVQAVAAAQMPQNGQGNPGGPGSQSVPGSFPSDPLVSSGAAVTAGLAAVSSPVSDPVAQMQTANGFASQGMSLQKGGDYKGAVASYREAADLLMQLSLPRAREIVEAMKTAELQDYFQDPAIFNARRKTSLKEIPEYTAVVYTLIFPQRVDLLLVMRSEMKRFTIPIDSESLSRQVNALRVQLQRRTRWDYPADARRFYNLLIAPLEPELNAKEIETLVFIPDGVLRTVPFAALNDGSRFLIERYAVVVAPGLDLTDPRALRQKKTRVLTAGLSESVQGFAPLANVKSELDGIQDLYKADRLENVTFKQDTVRDSLKGNPYSIVHIATHGNFAPSGSDSFLLTWDGRIDMNQLDQLMKGAGAGKGPVELLSLSACETAAGDDKAALGLAGVAIKAGSRSALATLWSVSDQAATELVLDFYQELRDNRVSKAEALQTAQLKLLDDPRYRHPYYWSPFLLIGNWM